MIIDPDAFKQKCYNLNAQFTRFLENFPYGQFLPESKAQCLDSIREYHLIIPQYNAIDDKKITSIGEYYSPNPNPNPNPNNNHNPNPNPNPNSNPHPNPNLNPCPNPNLNLNPTPNPNPNPIFDSRQKSISFTKEGAYLNQECGTTGSMQK